MPAAPYRGLTEEEDFCFQALNALLMTPDSSKAKLITLIKTNPNFMSVLDDLEAMVSDFKDKVDNNKPTTSKPEHEMVYRTFFLTHNIDETALNNLPSLNAAHAALRELQTSSHAQAYKLRFKLIMASPEEKIALLLGFVATGAQDDAEMILKQSPELLTVRGTITDPAGRTFTNVTAFEYALWAKDVYMIRMMMDNIPKESNLNAELQKQYEQVTAPLESGGGLSYELTYQRPNVNNKGIPTGITSETPYGTTTLVTERHTENHFNISPLLEAYENYENNLIHTHPPNKETAAYWVKIIGTLQHLLPINVLQHYCDSDNDFCTLSGSIPTFTGTFHRSLEFRGLNPFEHLNLLPASTISIDCALTRSAGGKFVIAQKAAMDSYAKWDAKVIRHLGEVRTKQIEDEIKPKLTVSATSNTPRF